MRLLFIFIFFLLLGACSEQNTPTINSLREQYLSYKIYDLENHDGLSQFAVGLHISGDFQYTDSVDTEKKITLDFDSLGNADLLSLFVSYDTNTVGINIDWKLFDKKNNFVLVDSGICTHKFLYQLNYKREIVEIARQESCNSAYNKIPVGSKIKKEVGGFGALDLSILVGATNENFQGRIWNNAMTNMVLEKFFMILLPNGPNDDIEKHDTRFLCKGDQNCVVLIQEWWQSLPKTVQQAILDGHVRVAMGNIKNDISKDACKSQIDFLYATAAELIQSKKALVGAICYGDTLEIKLKVIGN